MADEISVIDHGRVIAHGTPADLKQVVGGQTIAVRPADPDRLGEVAALLGAVTGHTAVTPGRGLLTVPVDGDAAFTAVVRRLDEAGHRVTELALRLPSLDEVFFSLTGHHTEEPAGKELVA